MRQTTVHKSRAAAAAFCAAEGSFCAARANTAILLDAALLASIFVALITLLGLSQISLLSLRALILAPLVLPHPKAKRPPAV